MNTNQLKYFIAIADRKSMKKAAEELYITHQCISTSMKRLEEELGTTLFERTSQGVSLNENGIEVYKMAEKILEEIDSTTKKLTDINTCEKNVLRIVTSFGMSELLFNNVIKAFRKKFPNVYLMTQNKSSLEAIESLRAGKSDLIYVGLPEEYSKSLKEEFICTDIFEEKMELLLPYNHFLAENSIISFEHVLKYPLILYQNVIEEEDNFMIKRMHKICENVNIAMICDNIDMHNEAIAEGIGFGFIGQSIVKSKVMVNRMQQLGIKNIKIKNGFCFQVRCFINKKNGAAKEHLIKEFREIFKKEMYLKRID